MRWSGCWRKTGKRPLVCPCRRRCSAVSRAPRPTANLPSAGCQHRNADPSEARMHRLTLVAGALLVVGACSSAPVNPRSAATLFEGARLITGEAGDPIESSAFLVEGNVIARVGRKGEVPLPDGAARVDLTGKTVMPAIINAHGHLGYRKGASFTAQNYTRENIIDHLERLAYHGVAAVMSMGAERELGYALRDELRAAPRPNTALFLTAGRGLAMPNGGPAPPVRDAPFGVSTEAE